MNRCLVCNDELGERVPDFCPEPLCGWETREDLQLHSLLASSTEQESARYQKRLQRAKERWERVQQMVAQVADKMERQPLVTSLQTDNRLSRRKTEVEGALDSKGSSDNARKRASHTVDGVEFHMRLAPAARFPMGWKDESEGVVERPYWIAETQVVYELWYTVRLWGEENGYYFSDLGMDGRDESKQGRSSPREIPYPVIRVNWYNCIVWCNALSEMLGYEAVYTDGDEILRDGSDEDGLDKTVVEDVDGFRLPTTEEWELAARYKNGSSWTPGNRASGASKSDNSATAEVAWYRSNTGGPKPVGQKKANGLGLYDMSGNVWEWCFDWKPEETGSLRVLRGGNWSDYASDVQVGRSWLFYDYLRIGWGGLRLVRTHI